MPYLFPHIGYALSLFWRKGIPIVRNENGKTQIFAALQVLFNIILMKSMLKNSCKAAKIEIVKTTALQELDLISRVKLAAGGQP